MTSIQRIESGKRMSKAVIHDNLIWISGQTSDGGASVTRQTQDVLTEVDRILEECGSSKTHILQVVIWLTNMDDFEEMNAVYDDWVNPKYLPARACGESRLADENINVEIIVTAAVQ
jgi:enamine deaminase RidA (YjgF/YER057c/UK114 family)